MKLQPGQEVFRYNGNMNAASNLLDYPSKLPKSQVVLTLTVEGKPRTKGRPRVTAHGTFTPSLTKEAERWIVLCIRRDCSGIRQDPDGYFGIRLAFYTQNRCRRDLDNMVKLVLDACTGEVWKDDTQVEEIYARVFRGDPNPRTEVVIYRVASPPPETGTCLKCGKVFRTFPSWGERKYCSRECLGAALRTGTEIPCANCGVSIHRSPHRLKAQASHYCSPLCRSRGLTVEAACLECRLVFQLPKCLSYRRAPLCSPACRLAYRKKQPLKEPRGTCKECGGPTSKASYQRCIACSKQGVRKLKPALKGVDLGNDRDRTDGGGAALPGAEDRGERGLPGAAQAPPGKARRKRSDPLPG